MNTCKARIETNDVIVVAEYGDRDHSDKVKQLFHYEFLATTTLYVLCGLQEGVRLYLP